MRGRFVSSESSLARPCCAVIRHAERADACWDVDAEDKSGIWPCDPKLSRDGLEEAVVATSELLASVKSDEVFHVVVSSPYMRCVQTAVQICNVIGPSAELMIDEQFGEIYGPDIMGEEEPENPLRPREEVWQYCRDNHVKIRSCVMGKSPVWPEYINQARLRFVVRFLRYLHRAALTRRNFIIVTHADGVAAALGMMPSMEGRILKKVDYCGFFVAQAGQGVALQKIKPAPQTETNRSELTTLGNPDSSGDSESSGHTDCSLLAANFAWQISYGRIKVGHRANEDLNKRISRWSRDSDFSEQEISRLLRFLPQEELTDALQSYGCETLQFAGVRTTGKSSSLSDDDSPVSSEARSSSNRNMFVGNSKSLAVDVAVPQTGNMTVPSTQKLKNRFSNAISMCCPYFGGYWHPAAIG